MTAAPLPAPKSKHCRACVHYAGFDWSVISEALRQNGHTTNTVDEYFKSYSGSNGRCTAKGQTTPSEDWCPKWQQREVGTSYGLWPNSVEEARVMSQFNPPKLVNDFMKPKGTK